MAYTPVTWTSGEDITAEKLNQMAANIDEMYQQFAAMRVDFDGRAESEGRPVKVWAGNTRLPPTKTTRSSITVDFPVNYFSPGCQPIVTVTMMRRLRNRVWLSVRGKGTGDANNWPDSTGVEIHGIIDPDAGYTFDLYEGVHIIAVGW